MQLEYSTNLQSWSVRQVQGWISFSLGTTFWAGQVILGPNRCLYFIYMYIYIYIYLSIALRWVKWVHFPPSAANTVSNVLSESYPGAPLISNSFQPYTCPNAYKCMVYLPTIYPLNYSVLQIHALHWQVCGALCFLTTKLLESKCVAKQNATLGNTSCFSVSLVYLSNYSLFIYKSTKGSRYRQFSILYLNYTQL